VILRRFLILLFPVVLILSGGCASTTERSQSASAVSPNDSADAPQTPDGFIRIILNENTGGFSLYYLAQPRAMRYVPLFNSRQPSASYLSISVNGNVHRLGRSGAYRTSLQRIDGNPAFVFESSHITVTQVFTPIKTANSDHANGVMITITAQNTGERRANVGFRLLIDTDLEEEQDEIQFLTSGQILTGETLIEGSSNERFWISRGSNASLMGSIINPFSPDSNVPDFVHIANWKRFNDVPWRLRYYEGRSFNNVPYSIGDSAVCYYFEPSPLDSERSVTYTVILSTEDVAWYNSAVRTVRVQTPVEIDTDTNIETEIETESETESVEIISFAPSIDIASIEEAARIEAEQNNEDPEMVTLLRLQEILNQFIAGEIELNERDMAEIESAINRLRDRN